MHPWLSGSLHAYKFVLTCLPKLVIYSTETHLLIEAIYIPAFIAPSLHLWALVERDALVQVLRGSCSAFNFLCFMRLLNDRLHKCEHRMLHQARKATLGLPGNFRHTSACSRNPSPVLCDGFWTRWSQSCTFKCNELWDDSQKDREYSSATHVLMPYHSLIRSTLLIYSSHWVIILASIKSDRTVMISGCSLKGCLPVNASTHRCLAVTHRLFGSVYTLLRAEMVSGCIFFKICFLSSVEILIT